MATNEVLSWSFLSKCKPSQAILEILVEGEQVLQCYKTIRDVAALTNKRIIVCDTQGFTGRKKEIYSLPYRSIDMWSSENKGTLDMSSELELWTKVGKMKLQLAAKCDIREFDRILGQAILNSK